MLMWQRRKNNFVLGLVSLAAVVGFLSVGALALGDTCTSGEFVTPAPFASYSLKVGEYLDYKLKAGTCDDEVELFFLSSVGTKNGGTVALNVQPTETADGTFFVARRKMVEAGDYPAARAKARIEREDETSYTVEINFQLTVTGTSSATSSSGSSSTSSGSSSTTSTSTTSSSSTPLKCPTPIFTSPVSGASLTGTQRVSISGNSAYENKVFAISNATGSNQLQKSTANYLDWNTATVPNGDYVITVWAECKEGYQASSAIASVAVKVNNPSPPSSSTSEGTGTVTYTSPSGDKIEVKPELLAVPAYRQTIAAPKNEVLRIKEVTPDISEDGKSNKITFKGTAKASSKYTLMVFSQPKQLDFTSDNKGNWQVELTDPLAPGDHEAYIVLNDRRGRPVERSAAISFVVPTAEAAAQAKSALAYADNRARYYATYVGLTVLAAIAAFTVYETIRRRRAARAQAVNIPAEPPATDQG